jgi:hypothetical protein
MINTQTQIDSLIDLAVIQRTELKQLVESLPQLRDHLSSEIERNLEEIEPAIRSELEQFVAARALDTQAKTSAELGAKLDAMARNLESTTAAKYSVLMAERAQNATLLAQAEARIAEAASALPGAVKGIVTDELARFPRAGEIDQLRKEFAEPRGLNPRGRWQVGETYNKLDLVSYNGDSYVSNTDSNREKPSRSSEAWTLSAARGNGGGGGGATSLTDLVPVPANGELLIGNGSAFVNNTLTAGTGVTITNGPGSITIDASGAQELLTATVTNAESFAITRGQVVYLFGAVGNRASVKLADNSSDATSSKTFGVVSDASIAANGVGLITCVGVVDKLALGAYSDGDTLYLGNTPGSVTATKPYAPNHLVYVGIIERANNGNGELYVRIQNGYELDEIHDVQITSAPLAGSLLMRDATNSLWKANRLTGTANQVTVTNADTAVTLSLPTAIANVNSVTAQSATNLTLAGGSTGASLVLGQGGNSSISLQPKGGGNVTVSDGGGGNWALISTVSSSSAGSSVYSSSPVGTITSSNPNWYVGHRFGAQGPLSIWTYNGGAHVANYLTITPSTGNVLIGTTTDTTRLTVKPGTNTYQLSLLQSNTDAAGWGMWADTSGNLNVTRYGSSAFGTPALVFSASGNATLGAGLTFSAPAILATSTTPSTGVGTGALQVAGGIYAGAQSTIAANLAITGDLKGVAFNTGTAGTYHLHYASVASAYPMRMSLSSDSVNTREFQIGYYTGDTTAGAWNNKFSVNGYTGAATFAGAVNSSAQYILTGNGSVPTASTIAIGTNGAGSRMLLNVPSAGEINFNVNGSSVGAISSTRSFYATQVMESVNSTASTNTTSGALVVAGGVGVGGALNVGGAVNAAGTVTMTATAGTTSPLKIINGLGTGDIYYADLGQSGITFGRFKRPQSGLFTNQFLTETYKGYGINMNALGDSGGSYILADNGTARLTIDSTGAATFGGAVAIGNTVNTVSPTSPNRTVTMVIGGVTYYLAAKTTND